VLAISLQEKTPLDHQSIGLKTEIVILRDYDVIVKGNTQDLPGSHELLSDFNVSLTWRSFARRMVVGNDHRTRAVI